MLKILIQTNRTIPLLSNMLKLLMNYQRSEHNGKENLKALLNTSPNNP